MPSIIRTCHSFPPPTYSFTHKFEPTFMKPGLTVVWRDVRNGVVRVSSGFQFLKWEETGVKMVALVACPFKTKADVYWNALHSHYKFIYLLSALSQPRICRPPPLKCLTIRFFIIQFRRFYEKKKKSIKKVFRKKCL